VVAIFALAGLNSLLAFGPMGLEPVRLFQEAGAHQEAAVTEPAMAGAEPELTSQGTDDPALEGEPDAPDHAPDAQTPEEAHHE
jgi:hypothetical protein